MPGSVVYRSTCSLLSRFEERFIPKFSEQRPTGWIVSRFNFAHDCVSAYTLEQRTLQKLRQLFMTRPRNLDRGVFFFCEHINLHWIITTAPCRVVLFSIVHRFSPTISPCLSRRINTRKLKEKKKEKDKRNKRRKIINWNMFLRKIYSRCLTTWIYLSIYCDIVKPTIN